MRADVAINSMITVMVAIIAAGMLIALAFGKLPELAKSLSCSAYSIMGAIVPSEGGVQPSLPAYCNPTINDTPKLEKGKNQTTEEIAAYILDCWEQGQKGGLNTTFICHQLNLDNEQNFVISANEITQIYLDNGLCGADGIQSNSTGCGTQNQITWTKNEIKNQDFILIEYTQGTVTVR